MTISLKHLFTSGKSDSGDPTIVQPSDWNREHVLTMATNRLLGRTSTGNGPAQELTVGDGLQFSGTILQGKVGSNFSYSGGALQLDNIKDDMGITNVDDVTKKLKFDLSGLATGMTRTLKIPDKPNLSLSSWELIGDYDLTGLATLVVRDLSAFEKLRITGSVVPGSSAGVGMQFSVDNGTTFISTADHYLEDIYMVGTGTPNGQGAVDYNYLWIIPFSIAPSNMGVVTANISGVNKASEKLSLFQAGGKSGSNLVVASGYSRSSNTNGNVVCNAIRLFPSVGVFSSGKLLIEGVRG